MQLHETIRGRLAGLHVPVPPIPRWAVIPAALGCALLLAGGIAVGTAVGNDPTAAGTTVLKVVQSGKVVTEHGVKKIVIPPKTVISHGRPVTLPARTVALGDTATAQVFLPGRTFVRNGRTVTAPGTTRTSTVTTTAPGTTVTTTTVVTSVQTTTATVVTTVTLPGTTITVTVSS